MMGDDTHVLEMLAALKTAGPPSWPSTISAPAIPTSPIWKRFNVDRLKIDQSFVRDMDAKPDSAVINTVIGMGASSAWNTLYR